MEQNLTLKHYLDTFAPEPVSLQLAREVSDSHGLPQIHIPSYVGRLIALLTRLKKPQRALEIGTLGGYSTLWIAQNMPKNSYLASIDIDPKHVSIARKNIISAALETKIEVIEGKALSILAEMSQAQCHPFELIFIDADKENYPAYLEYALEFSLVGTLILSDNLIPKNPTGPTSRALQAFNTALANHPRLETAIMPLIAHDGRLDAFGISLVTI